MSLHFVKVDAKTAEHVAVPATAPTPVPMAPAPAVPILIRAEGRVPTTGKDVAAFV